MDEKQKELNKLNPDSKAFEKKMEEIDDLVSAMTDITDESSKEVEEYFNSPEWKKQMADLENMDPLDKKELRKIEREAAKAAKEAKKVGKKAAKINIEAAEIGRKAAEKARIEVEKSKIDVEAARKVAEQAKVIAEQARQEAETAMRNISFTTINSSPKVMVMQADFIKKDGNGDITMNGVKSII